MAACVAVSVVAVASVCTVCGHCRLLVLVEGVVAIVVVAFGAAVSVAAGTYLMPGVPKCWPAQYEIGFVLLDRTPLTT